jgi:hypothetical protein
METIYVLHPGIVISRADGERHYVTAKALIELYGLDSRRHTYMDRDAFHQFARNCRSEKKIIHLYPLANGDYKRVEG